MQIPQKILCPTDFSDNSLIGLRYALELARLLNAKVELLYVHHLPMHRVDMHAPKTVEELPPAARQEIDKHFRDLIAEVGPEAQGLHVTTRVEVGQPHEKIVEYADGGDTDLIVMATLGRSGISRLLVGSVAERTLRLSSKPVLTVPTR